MGVYCRFNAIYTVLVAGGYLPTAVTTKHEKIKAKGGKN